MYVTFLSVLFCCFLLLSLYSHVFFFQFIFFFLHFWCTFDVRNSDFFSPAFSISTFHTSFLYYFFFLTYHTIASAFTSFFL